jgi:hypothetical protein
MDDPFHPKTPGQQVSKLLESRSLPIAQLLAIAKRLSAIEEIIVDLVEPEFRGRVRCAAISDGKLLLLTPSSAIANALRWRAPALAQLLREKGFKDVREVNFRIAPLPANRHT